LLYSVISNIIYKVLLNHAIFFYKKEGAVKSYDKRPIDDRIPAYSHCQHSSSGTYKKHIEIINMHQLFKQGKPLTNLYAYFGTKVWCAPARKSI